MSRDDHSPITLEEDDPNDFHLYMHWLYTTTLPTKTEPKAARAELGRLIRAYIFGDKLLDNSYKNGVIVAAIETMHECSPNADHVPLVYKATAPDAPL
ncbi:hypothetical protein K458DRAFT_416878 [Lentithecium fluviatile CBS 122367]|uniref:BTB domain-containing protein n=1 Tax=Lentithecium fluviatile CBS 122367 TaxID=1168545 RepID=A0A6G1J5G5_9PLEO|nr:hypothetical protein K458DRAFT_416878 [Lentithecium fluviatile CBS 122367]